MKNSVSKLALAALVIGSGIAMATPAHAVSYYDTYGRAYYYNTWGQPVYYDTGYSSQYAPRQAAPAATYTQTTYSAAQPVYDYAQEQPEPAYRQQPTYTQTSYMGAPAYQQQQTTTYQPVAQQPLMAAVPPSYGTQATYAPATYAPADASQTTYQYYYPDGSSAQTTYVSSTTSMPAPTNASTVCRQNSRTENQWNGEIQTRYTTECQQSDGSWLEQ